MYRNCSRCNSAQDEDYYENSCPNIEDDMDDYGSCSCGFDNETSEFPSNPTIAESYVARQVMDRVFNPTVGLKMGTIYPELVSPYEPGQSMEVINYLSTRNESEMGCNG